ncbi:MAG TPA: hypothetical protein ENI62_03630 [Gammaproteobacteria bacterium]|nr:hypothetical protein [Gammaproteobacteria bacterium]
MKKTTQLLGIFLGAVWLNLAAAGNDVVNVEELDIEYAPDAITLQLGQTLHLVNKDPFFHNSRISVLKADGSEGTVVMKAKKELPNDETDFKFTKTGKYKIRCMVHDGMTAVVTVTK